jgi:hypothetical protein
MKSIENSNLSNAEKYLINYIGKRNRELAKAASGSLEE